MEKEKVRLKEGQTRTIFYNDTSKDVSRITGTYIGEDERYIYLLVKGETIRIPHSKVVRDSGGVLE